MGSEPTGCADCCPPVRLSKHRVTEGHFSVELGRDALVATVYHRGERLAYCFEVMAGHDLEAVRETLAAVVDRRHQGISAQLDGEVTLGHSMFGQPDWRAAVSASCRFATHGSPLDPSML